MANEYVVYLFYLCKQRLSAYQQAQNPVTHLFIWTDPTAPLHLLGSVLNEIFKVIEPGGVIKKPHPHWYTDNPYNSRDQEAVAARAHISHDIGGVPIDTTSVEHAIRVLERS